MYVTVGAENCNHPLEVETMRNDTIQQLSVACLDDDCNVGLIDEDGDGVPDFVILRIRWIIVTIVSLTSAILSIAIKLAGL